MSPFEDWKEDRESKPIFSLFRNSIWTEFVDDKIGR